MTHFINRYENMPSIDITNGPGDRDLELAYVGRKLGTRAKFTAYIDGIGKTEIQFRIHNFEQIGCWDLIYHLGGAVLGLKPSIEAALPNHNFIFIVYDANKGKREGKIFFSNGE